MSAVLHVDSTVYTFYYVACDLLFLLRLVSETGQVFTIKYSGALEMVLGSYPAGNHVIG